LRISDRLTSLLAKAPVRTLLVAAAIASLGAAEASATVTLGSASNFALLNGNNDTVRINGGSTITGNMGVGSSDTFSGWGTASTHINGTLYEGGAPSGTTGSVTISGGAVINASMISTAISDANAAASAAAALAATVTVPGNLINIIGSSLTIKALTNLSENVINITNLNIKNGSLIFDDNGFTGAKFVVNVTGTGSFTMFTTGSNTSSITGINGAAASDILFNIESTGQTVSISGNSSAIGTILAPTSNVSLNGGSLTGEIIAGFGSVSKSYTIDTQQSNFTITQASYKKVPEPGTIALFGAGIAALALVRRRRAA